MKLGLGLWNSIPLTIVIELALFGGGIASYLRATRARDRMGTWGLCGRRGWTATGSR